MTISFISAQQVMAYPLSMEQRQRFKQFLPNTFQKLEARDNVHVLALGEASFVGQAPSGDRPNANALFAMPGEFTERLARGFFYPGGVRLVNAPAGTVKNRSEIQGTAITLETSVPSDNSVFGGLRHAAGDAFVHDPDLVMIQFGGFDALSGTAIHNFRAALTRVVRLAREQGADVILCAPTPIFADTWGLSRPYARAVESVAREEQVFFLDLGQLLLGAIGGADPDAEPSAAQDLVSDRLRRFYFFGDGKGCSYLVRCW